MHKRIQNWFQGRRAERVALRHLRRAGLRFIEGNVRVGRDEIDLVMLEAEVLVFVEVKSSARDLVSALHEFDQAKRRRFQRAVKAYRAREGIREVPHRLDLVAITRRDGDWQISWTRGL